MTNFFDTKQGQRASAKQRVLDVQYNAALAAEVREAISPWPVMDTVRAVFIGAMPAEPKLVTISVIDGQGHIHTRAREIQDSFAEAFGYASRCGWNYSIDSNVPMAFRVPFAEMVAAAPAK